MTRLADGLLCRPSGTWFHFVCLTPGLKSWAIVFRRSAAWSFFRFASYGLRPFDKLRAGSGLSFRRSAAWSFFRFASHGLRPFDKLRAGCGLHSCAALRLRSGQAYAASVYVSWGFVGFPKWEFWRIYFGRRVPLLLRVWDSPNGGRNRRGPCGPRFSFTGKVGRR
jgi:hypothetical protein